MTDAEDRLILPPRTVRDRSPAVRDREDRTGTDLATRPRRRLLTRARRLDRPAPTTPPEPPREHREDHGPRADIVGPVVVGELVDEEDRPARVMVDQPPGPAVWAPPWDRPERRSAVVPDWVRDRDQRRHAAAWAGRHVRHVTAFHGSRLPVYAGRALAASPRGAGRVVAGSLRWAVDAESAPLRRAAVARGDSKEYLALTRQSRERSAGRTAVLTSAVLVAAGWWWMLGRLGPSWDRTLLVLAVLAVLGTVGRRRDRPLLDTAVVSPQAQRLTSDVVTRGLTATGVAKLAKAEAVDFVAPIVRDGPGWRAEVDLPDGVIAGDVLDTRERLASGLRRPLGCVWPEAVPKIHPGRLVLFVGDQEMAATKAPPWPLLKSGRVNIFRPFPFGTDVRNRTAPITLIYASGVIGAVPRMGKTFSARLLLLAGALDPRVELHAYDLKGTGDFSPIEPVAHRYRAGDDLDDIRYALADLRALREEMRRRTKVIRGLPPEACPESKVTDELASVASYRLHPVLMLADECQRWFEHPEHGTEIEEICDDLVRRGPATGIMAWFATQRPDTRSLPKGISDNVVLRFCLKVIGHVANDMVLGTSAYKTGTRATMFARTDLGIGYLSGEGADPQIVRSFYVDRPAAVALVARARALRAAAGTITGHAAGDTFADDSGPDWSLVADVLAVMGEEKLHSDVLCERLAERWDRYAGWKPEQLAAALKPLRVQTRQVHTTGTDGALANRRGLHRADVVKAAERAGEANRGT